MFGKILDWFGTSYKSRTCDSLYNLACVGKLTYSLPKKANCDKLKEAKILPFQKL